MQYWLMKTEPHTYAYADLEHDGSTWWDGVRNYQARNNMKAMKKGDQVLIYHSVSEKAVVGIATVQQEWAQDPTTDDERWVAVQLIPMKALKHPVTLASIKDEPALVHIPLVTQARLSVMPLDQSAFDKIVQMAHSL